MHRFVFFLLLCSSFLSANDKDFDVVIVGSSPFSLLEALYRYHMGESVLILEQDEVCGGAWRSIDVCGVSHVDMGCHQIGHDPHLLHFLKDYVGCNMVSLDNPLAPFMSGNTNGYYFSGGCHELITHLLNLIEKTKILLLLNHRLESVKVDPIDPFAIVKSNGMEIKVGKVIIPLYASIVFEDISSQIAASKSKYPHLYLLIEDPSPPRFSYHSGIGPGFSRMMNLTHFAKMAETGKQLMVFQSYGALTFETGEKYLELLKEKELVHSSAKLLTVDSYIYEQCNSNRSQIFQVVNGTNVFETLNSGHLQNLSQYVTKWQSALKPYSEAMQIN